MSVVLKNEIHTLTSWPEHLLLAAHDVSPGLVHGEPDHDGGGRVLGGLTQVLPRIVNMHSPDLETPVLKHDIKYIVCES